MNNTKKEINCKLKNKIIDFWIDITENIWKVKSKFTLDMLFWLLISNNTKLSEIWRWLKEETKIKHTEKRLSRNLQNFEEENIIAIKENLLNDVSKRITNDTVITLDWWDINKEWAIKMENIKYVHDWNKGKTCNWYWLNSIVATNVKTVKNLWNWKEWN